MQLVLFCTADLQWLGTHNWKQTWPYIQRIQSVRSSNKQPYIIRLPFEIVFGHNTYIAEAIGHSPSCLAAGLNSSISNMPHFVVTWTLSIFEFPLAEDLLYVASSFNRFPAERYMECVEDVLISQKLFCLVTSPSCYLSFTFAFHLPSILSTTVLWVFFASTGF